MQKSKKVEIVKYLSDEFKNADTIIVCEYKGLNVKQLEALRIPTKENDIKVQVVKNTLANLAFKNVDLSQIQLSDTNILIWGDEAISLCKIISKFAKENANLVFKIAYINKKITELDKIEVFAKLPTKEELIGMLGALWLAPIRNFTIGLNQLKEKKESEGK